MSDLKDWLARDVLIVGKLEAADEIYIPGCGYYQPDPGAHVIICESAEPLIDVPGEETAFNVDESLAASENVILRDLAIENAKLRELIVGAYKDMDAWQRVIASSDQWGYGKGCLEQLCRLQDAMRELGIEVAP